MAKKIPLLFFCLILTALPVLAKAPIKKPTKLPSMKKGGYVPEKTLDEYEREADQESALNHKQHDEPESAQNKKSLKKFNHNEFYLAPGVALGKWSSQPSNTSLLGVGYRKTLVPDPFYFALGIQTFFSPSTPRNFQMGVLFAGGLQASQMHGTPFLGVSFGASQVSASGRGRTFGTTAGVEAGIYPFHIKDYPVCLRVQLSRLLAKLDGNQPQWVLVSLGFVF